MVLARLDHTRSSHFERVLVMWNRQRLPFELWLGRGLSLNPYLRGIIIDLLHKALQEAMRIVDELFVQPEMKDFLESSTFRVWVKDGRRYLRYCASSRRTH